MFHLQFYMSEAGEKAERSLGVEELLFILCSSHMEVRVHLWFVLETHVLAVPIDLLCYLGLKLIQHRVTIKTTNTPWVLPHPRAHLNAINMSLHLNFNTEAYFFSLGIQKTWGTKRLNCLPSSWSLWTMRLIWHWAYEPMFKCSMKSTSTSTSSITMGSCHQAIVADAHIYHFKVAVKHRHMSAHMHTHSNCAYLWGQW